MKKYFYITIFVFLIQLANAAKFPWDDESCAFEKIDLKLNSKALVEEYLKRDFNGDFLKQNKWMDQAILCPGHAPGPDTSTVINKYEIVKFSEEQVVIKYKVVGLIDSEKFESKTQEESVTVKIKKTPFGYKIDDSFVGGSQHISVKTAIQLATSNKLNSKNIKSLRALEK